MPILELCAGYGGLGLAVEALTGEHVSVVAETDPAASKVLAARFPDVPNIGDITAYDWRELRGAEWDITAGFPCQDISTAGGPGGGINGKRSGIWKNVAAAVRVLRPRRLFLENVSVIRRRGLDVVLADLATLGYDARWGSLRASEVGAPHPRDRWFLVAHPHGAGLEIGGAQPQGPKWEALGRSGPLAEDTHCEPAPERGGTAAGEEESGRTWSDLGGRSGLSPAVWWGDYLPAIRRWEDITGHPAPAPTEVGPRGGRRLTARFPEWMQGLPDGWITSVDGLTRADAIRLAGNGVVPQQAYEAFRRLALD
ncbi:DNA cytosine methyltransferase [Streptomyces lavendulae]|uniref:DNA cytosine methyltransferase n=1 Tax=Streptomyces lavendulae TaxID=1914 RepID=UPI0033CA0D81